MKNLFKFRYTIFLLIPLMVVIVTACSDDSSVINDDSDLLVDNALEASDVDALLFMLEEEKLARDTYTYLGDLWSVNQFNNIKSSEQTHMNAIADLLNKNNIDYTILPIGEFENNELQELYTQFKNNGTISKANALQIGATIEDLDIVDLENYISKISDSSITSVFESLKCGSRNHLRSFVKSIENSGDNYSPQFLSLDDYFTIINGSQEKCN